MSFRLPKGKTLGLVGESGSGKTTVGLTLMRLHEATTGEAIFEGRDLLAMSPTRVHAVQAAHPDHLPESVRVAQSALHRRPDPRSSRCRSTASATSTQERTDMAFELLDKVGLAEVSFYKYPHEFSGGQRQRIAIARCLTMKPGHPDLRRVGVGARRVGAGAGAEPAAGPAGRVRAVVHLHLARSRRRQVHLRPGDGDERGRDRRDRGFRRDLPASEDAVHASGCSRRSRRAGTASTRAQTTESTSHALSRGTSSKPVSTMRFRTVRPASRSPSITPARRPMS